MSRIACEHNVKAVILYHGDWDGAASAWVVTRALRAGWCGEVPTNIVAMVAHYGDAPPIEACRGADVYVVDFCYSFVETVRLHEVAKRLTVIDHHATSAWIRDSDFFKAHWNIERSAARLAWESLSPGYEPIPNLVLYVEDHDLWRFSYPDSREAKAWLQAWEPTIDNAELCRVWFDGNFEVIRREGKRILDYERQAVEMSASPRQVLLASIADGRGVEYLVAACNTSGHVSEVCELLLNRHCDVEIAACWWQTTKGWRVTLRSRDGGPDCSLLAKLHGGGGHPRAAGFQACDLSMFLMKAW